MEEISIILRDNKVVSIEEFRILEEYASSGRIWTVIERSEIIIQTRANEYIFDPETLIFFRLISQNVLATWNTNITRNFGLNDEYHIGGSLWIRPHNGWHY